MKKFIIWCSPIDSPGPKFKITGQGLMTCHVIHQFSSNSLVICPTSLNLVHSIFKLLLATLFADRVQSVYLVASRTFYGFFRDLPVLLLSLFGIRVVAHIHGSDLDTLFANTIIGKPAYFLYSRLACVIFPSNYECARIASAYPNLRARVIGNFIPTTVHLGKSMDVSRKDFLGSLGCVDMDVPVLFWNSNLLASKGLFDLLTALTHVHELGVSFKMVFIGRFIGDHLMSAEQSKKLFYQFSDQTWFHYLGPVSFSHSLLLCELCDIVCLPSKYPTECQPLALLSAIKYSKAIVVSNLPQIVEMLQAYPLDRVFYSFPGDVKSLRSSLSSAIQICPVGKVKVSSSDALPIISDGEIFFNKVLSEVLLI